MQVKGVRSGVGDKTTSEVRLEMNLDIWVTHLIAPVAICTSGYMRGLMSLFLASSVDPWTSQARARTKDQKSMAWTYCQL